VSASLLMLANFVTIITAIRKLSWLSLNHTYGRKRIRFIVRIIQGSESQWSVNAPLDCRQNLFDFDSIQGCVLVRVRCVIFRSNLVESLQVVQLSLRSTFLFCRERSPIHKVLILTTWMQKKNTILCGLYHIYWARVVLINNCNAFCAWLMPANFHLRQHSCAISK